jgi:hypothetical protein
MSYEFTRLPEVEVLENLTENAHLIVEDGGKTRRFPASEFSGGEGGLTVIDMGEFDSDGKYTLSESEISALESAKASMMPVIIKFSHNGSLNVSVFHFTSIDGGFMSGFIGYLNGYDYTIMNAMGSWEARAYGQNI